MKDRTPTISYTKEARALLYPALSPQSIQSSREQSDIALGRSRDTSLCCLAASRSERRRYLNAAILACGDTTAETCAKLKVALEKAQTYVVGSIALDFSLTAQIRALNETNLGYCRISSERNHLERSLVQAGSSTNISPVISKF
jgi:hypothetical protein